MHPKTQTYIDLGQSAARQITSNYRSWTGFLNTASRLYKYSYSDQLLIHAQRPDATACASYEIWNQQMHRYVRRGSKGIALLDVRAGQVGLRYVFDVADTGTRQQSRTPFVWSVDEHNSLAFLLCWNMNTPCLLSMGCPIIWMKSPRHRQSPTGRITATMHSVSLTILSSPGMMNMRSKRPSAGP